MAAVWLECRKCCLAEPSDAPSASCMVLDLTQGDATGNTCRKKKKAEAWTDHQTKATAMKVIILGRTFNVVPWPIKSLSVTINANEVIWWGQ